MQAGHLDIVEELCGRCNVPINTVDLGKLTPMDLARASNLDCGQQETLCEAMQHLGALTYEAIQDRAASVIQRLFRSYLKRRKLGSFQHIASKVFAVSKGDELRGFPSRGSGTDLFSDRFDGILGQIRDPKSRARERVEVEDDGYGWKVIVTDFIPAGGGANDKQTLRHILPSILRAEVGVLSARPMFADRVIQLNVQVSKVVTAIGKAFSASLTIGMARFEKVWQRPKALMERIVSDCDVFIDERYRELTSSGGLSRDMFAAFVYEMERLYSVALETATLRHVQKDSSMASSAVHSLLCASYDRVSELGAWVMCRMGTVMKEVGLLGVSDELMEQLMEEHTTVQLVSQRLLLEVEALDGDVTRKVTAVTTAKLLVGRTIAVVLLTDAVIGLQQDDAANFGPALGGLWESIGTGRSVVTQLENSLKNLVAGEYSIYEVCPSVCRVHEVFRTVECLAAIFSGMEEIEALGARSFAAEDFVKGVAEESERVVARSLDMVRGMDAVVDDSSLYVSREEDMEVEGDDQCMEMGDEEQPEEVLIQIPDLDIDQIKAIPRLTLVSVLVSEEDQVDAREIDPYANWTYVGRLMESVPMVTEAALSASMQVTAQMVLTCSLDEYQEVGLRVRNMLNSLMLLAGEFVEPHATGADSVMKLQFSELSNYLLSFKNWMSEVLDTKYYMYENLSRWTPEYLAQLAELENHGSWTSAEALARATTLGRTIPGSKTFQSMLKREEVMFASAGMYAAAVLKMIGAEAVHGRVWRRVWSTSSDRVEMYMSEHQPRDGMMRLMGGPRTGMQPLTPRVLDHEEFISCELSFHERLARGFAAIDVRLGLYGEHHKPVTGYVIPRAASPLRLTGTRSRYKRSLRKFRGPMYIPHVPLKETRKEDVHFTDEDMPELLPLSDGDSEMDSDPASDDEAGRERLLRRNGIKVRNAGILQDRKDIEVRKLDAMERAAAYEVVTGYKRVGYAVRLVRERRMRRRLLGCMAYEALSPMEAENMKQPRCVGDFNIARGGRFEKRRVATLLWRERARMSAKDRMRPSLRPLGVGVVDVSDESDWGDSEESESSGDDGASDTSADAKAGRAQTRHERRGRKRDAELGVAARAPSKGAKWLRRLMGRQIMYDERTLMRRLCGVLVAVSIGLGGVMTDVASFCGAGLTSNCILSNIPVVTARSRLAQLLEERAHEVVIPALDSLVERTVSEHGRLRDMRYQAVIPTPWMASPQIADRVNALHGCGRDVVETTCSATPQASGLAAGIAPTANKCRRCLTRIRKLLSGIVYSHVSNQLVHPDASTRLIIEGAHLVGALIHLGQVGLTEYNKCLRAVRGTAEHGELDRLPRVIVRKRDRKKGNGASGKGAKRTKKGKNGKPDGVDDKAKGAIAAAAAAFPSESALVGSPSGPGMLDDSTGDGGRALNEVVAEMDRGIPVEGSGMYSNMVADLVSMVDVTPPVTEELLTVHPRASMLMRTLAFGTLARSLGTAIELLAPVVRHVTARRVVDRIASLVRRLILSVIQYGTVCGFLSPLVARSALAARHQLAVFLTRVRDVNGGFLGKHTPRPQTSLESRHSYGGADPRLHNRRADHLDTVSLPKDVVAGKRSVLPRPPPPSGELGTGGTARSAVARRGRHSNQHLPPSAAISQKPGVPGVIMVREQYRQLVPVPPGAGDGSAGIAAQRRRRVRRGGGEYAQSEEEEEGQLQEVIMTRGVPVRPTLEMVAARDRRRGAPPMRRKRASPFAAPVAPRASAQRFIPRRPVPYDVEDW